MNFYQNLIKYFSLYELPIFYVILTTGMIFLIFCLIFSKRIIQKKWVIILAAIMYFIFIFWGLFYLIFYLILGSWLQNLLIIVAFGIYFFCLWQVYQRWKNIKKDVSKILMKISFWLLISWAILGTIILVMNIVDNKNPINFG